MIDKLYIIKCHKSRDNHSVKVGFVLHMHYVIGLLYKAFNFFLSKLFFLDLKLNMIKVIPLGAGQDVGRSCILVSMGDDSTGIKNIMFDCGMHMGYNDERRFPDFSYISKTIRLYYSKSLSLGSLW
jgi:hypothetical protein